MEIILISVTIVLSLLLIILVTLLPRQTQIFSNDATSNIGKPSYWSSQTGIKILILASSVLLFLCLFGLMILSYRGQG